MIDIYTDGGLLSRNPSSLGCTCAFVAVEEDRVIEEMAWRIVPREIGMEDVSSNIAELLAVIFALRWVGTEQPGWAGLLHTDSEVTATRLRRLSCGLQPKFTGVPSAVQRWLRHAIGRVGNFGIVEIAGHPTKAELEAGKDKKAGLPVSKWNVRCDKLCNLAKEYAT